MPRLLSRILLAALASFAITTAATATPKRIILLRHAEKKDDYALCDMGRLRAEALAQQFLGRGAQQSVFGTDGKPAALMAITVHTYETIAPLAKSWSLPVTDYAVALDRQSAYGEKEADENFETQLAARDVLADPRYDGKVVVMVWEHKRIASAKLEKEYPDQKVTLRQLLNLDQIKGVPASWPDETYDYIWEVDYHPGSQVPVGFKSLREDFTGAFQTLPTNNWKTPEPRHIAAGCLK